MSRNEWDQRGSFFMLVQSFHDLERMASSKTFPLSIEMAITTPSVDEKPFLCHATSTEIQASVVCLVQRSLAEASYILFLATCLNAAVIQ